MSGPKATEQQQSNLANTQLANAATTNAQSQQSLATMNQLTAPSIAYNSGIVNAANSGNYSGLIQSAGPAVGTLATNALTAAQNIRQSVPAGAGQQAALSQLPYQQAQATSSTLNSAYQGALSQLLQTGAAYGGVGLQQGNLALSGTQAAGNSLSAVAQEKNATKASNMSALGSLAGLGGQLATGGIFSGAGAAASAIPEASTSTSALMGLTTPIGG